MPPDAVQEVFFPPACGPKGRNARLPAPSFEVLGSLEACDLEALEALAPQVAPGAKVLQLRESHHAAARSLAEGQSLFEASIITGYSPAYLSGLKRDPAFAELIAFYVEQGTQARADLMERLKLVGLSATDELLRRLEEDPDAWSRRELMELAELTLMKAGHAGQKTPAGGGNAPPVSLNIQFIDADPAKSAKLVESTTNNPLELEVSK